MRLVLASSSATRRRIMDEFKLKYDVMVSGANEESQNEDPRAYVEELSNIKAEAVEKLIDDNDSIIIAADTIIYKDGVKLEKPKSYEDVVEKIKFLSGGVNQGITGVTLIDTKLDIKITFSCVTNVYFKEMSNDEIVWYIEKEKDWMYEASGYTLDGPISLFVEKIEGDFYNVLGLPMSKIYEKIKELGYSIKDFQGE